RWNCSPIRCIPAAFWGWAPRKHCISRASRACSTTLPRSTRYTGATPPGRNNWPMPDTPIRILIVDDVPQNLAALEAALDQPDAELVTAASGEEALELMLRHDFALALLDVQLPGIDGFELAELMRGTDRTRGVPIIFLTAVATDETR